MTNLVPFKMLSAVTVLDSSLEGWTLLEPPAATVRSHARAVTFERPFGAVPLVHIGIAGIDAGGDNLRLRVSARDVTAKGFVVHAETWFGSQVWSVEVSWLAIGV